MPATPLTAALMGGQGGADNSGSLDPSVMALQPQLTLAQTMIKNGLDTSPATGWQAAGRLAQAIAGTYNQQSAISDLSRAFNQQALDAAKTLPPGHPLIAALTSSNIGVQMRALDAYKQAQIEMGEQQRTGPGQSVSIGGQTVYNNNSLRDPNAIFSQDQSRLTGQPPISPLAAAKLKAEAEASGRSDFEPGGDVVVPGPDGPITIPATAATRARMQPGGVPAAPPALGPATPPPTPSVPASARSIPPSPAVAFPPPAPQTAPTGPINAAVTAPGVTGKLQDRVPASPMAGAAPPPAVTGRPLANPAIEPAVKADVEELAKDRESAAKGQQDVATIQTIKDLLPKVTTGWSADERLQAARVLKAAGVSDPSIDGTLAMDVPSGQVLQKKFVELSAAAARNMGAREPGSVISMFAKAYPNLGTDKDAITLQSNGLLMDRLRSQQMAQQKTNFLNDSINGVQSTGKYRGLKGFNEQFNQASPPENYVHAAEAMSGNKFSPWGKFQDPGNQPGKFAAQRQSVIDLIPSGSQFTGPDGSVYIKP